MDDSYISPTLAAYRDSHPEVEALTDLAEAIPVIGTIGIASIERLFCRLAHQAAAGADISPHRCPHYMPDADSGISGAIQGMIGSCALTAGRSTCLLIDRADPLWDLLQTADINYSLAPLPSAPSPPTEAGRYRALILSTRTKACHAYSC